MQVLKYLYSYCMLHVVSVDLNFPKEVHFHVRARPSTVPPFSLSPVVLIPHDVSSFNLVMSSCTFGREMKDVLFLVYMLELCESS